MTVMIENHPSHRHTGRGFHHVAHMARAIADMMGAALSTLDAWRAARALHRLDDAALKDLGVPRGNIDGMVKNGRSEV